MGMIYINTMEIDELAFVPRVIVFQKHFLHTHISYATSILVMNKKVSFDNLYSLGTEKCLFKSFLNSNNIVECSHFMTLSSLTRQVCCSLHYTFFTF